MGLWLQLLQMLLLDVLDAKNAQIDKEPANIEELTVEAEKLLLEGEYMLQLTNIMIAQMEQIIAKNAIENSYQR